MIKLYKSGVYLLNGEEIICDNYKAADIIKNKLGGLISKEEALKNTMTYGILKDHNFSSDMDRLKLKFDALASHDLTYVGIVQTAKASGIEMFPIPYVMTNCHNSLCSVGGTINKDDHMFGLSAVKKYGGIYVPAHQAVIHQYMRETMAQGGKMILGSDSHTRYGALGAMGIGEGGGELVKQLLGSTYDIDRPEVIGVYLTGRPQKGVGPQDIALAIIGKVFENGFVKNKVMEFVGDGIKNLNVEFRNGIDVMTTETTCLSSIWATDNKVKDYYEAHGRVEEYSEIEPSNIVYYDGMLYVNMSKIKPMIAMPFHPSNVYTIEEVTNNPYDVLKEVEKKAKNELDITINLMDKIKNGRLYVEQGIIAGCAGGTYDNICDAADIIRGKSVGNGEFALSVYPSSQPTYLSLMENGYISTLMTAGVDIKTAFCGPCFGAGDVPANNSLSIRHTTRNFPNREGSKPSDGQIASVALMDARSIAATAINGGYLTSAADLDVEFPKPKYYFNREIYKNRCYDGFGRADSNIELKLGPNIVEWPEMSKLTDNILLKVVSVIMDPVTTTDELIPSGNTSSYRSNPIGLSEFTLSRKDPNYVGKAKAVNKFEKQRIENIDPTLESDELKRVFEMIRTIDGFKQIAPLGTGVGSTIYAVKPGDGSAREQAASCQRVLGGWANIVEEYATKRYRSNLINWGMLPFILNGKPEFECDDYIFIPNITEAILNGDKSIKCYVLGAEIKEITLTIDELTEDEKNIILAGSLINYNRENN